MDMEEHVRNLSDLLKGGKLEEAKLLLSKVPELILADDSACRSAVHFSALYGCLPILKFVINEDGNAVNRKDSMGWTPLMIAVSAGRLDVVHMLLSLPSVDINHKNSNGQSALHYAASKNYKEITKILIIAGADINAIDNYGATALHRAASQGHIQIVHILLNEPKLHLDAKNCEGNTPLLLACEEGYEDVAIVLTRSGANLNMKNKADKSPMDVMQSFASREKLCALGRHDNFEVLNI